MLYDFCWTQILDHLDMELGPCTLNAGKKLLFFDSGVESFEAVTNFYVYWEWINFDLVSMLQVSCKKEHTKIKNYLRYPKLPCNCGWIGNSLYAGHINETSSKRGLVWRKFERCFNYHCNQLTRKIWKNPKICKMSSSKYAYHRSWELWLLFVGLKHLEKESNMKWS